jgi:hypothetical protein
MGDKVVKKLLILFILVCFISPAFVFSSMMMRRRPLLVVADVATTTTTSVGGDECTGRIVCQNFEAVGYDNGETWSDSGANPNYTVNALRGSQSCLLASSGNWARPEFASQSEVWGFFRFSSSDVSTDCDIFRLRQSTTNRLVISVNNSNIILTHGSASDTGATTLSVDTTYFVWFHYKKGTGADGEGNLWISTSVTKPGSEECTITNGSSTTDVTRSYIYIDSSPDVIYDQVLIDDAVINSVDS